MATEPREMS